jgi:hypothetical protein
LNLLFDCRSERIGNSNGENYAFSHRLSSAEIPDLLQAAYAAAAWLQRADHEGSLNGFLKPSLTADEREVANIEGWILGVV